MVISYGLSPTLLVRYFSVEILQRINQHLTTLEKKGGAAHEIAVYKQLRIALQRIQAVTASDVAWSEPHWLDSHWAGVRIPLGWLN